MHIMANSSMAPAGDFTSWDTPALAQQRHVASQLIALEGEASLASNNQAPSWKGDKMTDLSPNLLPLSPFNPFTSAPSATMSPNFRELAPPPTAPHGTWTGGDEGPFLL
eukprot:Trichotokara_eunicae@DN4882_c0_g1_i2.p1